jgi:radical SAM protein with 4Fe4S-binding SPASM domain
MLPESFLTSLPESRPALGQFCIPLLCILSNGQVISCYGLAHHHQEPLPTTQDVAWLRARFTQQQERDRPGWLYPECDACHWRLNGQCTGGCLAQARNGQPAVVPCRSR